jgi:aspartate racemase
VFLAGYVGEDAPFRLFLLQCSALEQSFFYLSQLIYLIINELIRNYSKQKKERKLKTLGLIGGTTWLSTIDYYRIINQQVNERLGRLNSAKIYLYSLNFEEFRPPADPDKWVGIADRLTHIALRLENAGAECLIICANTPHLVADEVQQGIHIPLLHIAEATAAEIKKHKMEKVGLLGTKFTMEQNFFKDKLSQQHIETLIPGSAEREYINHTIFDELGKEIFSPQTKMRYIGIINQLVAEGAEGIIFGCTEIPLLLKQEDCSVPVFNTTLIHAKAAVAFALSGE